MGIVPPVCNYDLWLTHSIYRNNNYNFCNTNSIQITHSTSYIYSAPPKQLPTPLFKDFTYSRFNFISCMVTCIDHDFNKD